MADLGGFDASQIDPAAPPEELLPAGYHRMAIVASEMKATSTGGSQLVLRLKVLAGKYQNCETKARITRTNATQKAVEIGDRELSAVCRAVGVLRPTDSSQLHNKPLDVLIGHREYDGKLFNDVKGFRKAEGDAPTPVASPPTPQPAATTSVAANPFE